jgi:hypothetical protein
MDYFFFLLSRGINNWLGLPDYMGQWLWRLEDIGVLL